jgi:hypothetical protein
MRSHEDTVSWSRLGDDWWLCLPWQWQQLHLVVIGLPLLQLPSLSKSHELGKDHGHVFDQICWLQLIRPQTLGTISDWILICAVPNWTELWIFASQLWKFSSSYERTTAGIPTVWHRWSSSLLLPLSQIISHFRFVLSQIYLTLTKYLAIWLSVRGTDHSPLH